MNIFPNILLWKNFQNIIKLKNFYSGHVHIHHPHSTIGFLCYFSPTSSPVYPSIHQPILFFDAFQRKLQISVNLFLNTSTCYTTFLCISCISILNCDLQWRIVYVFKIIVQRQGLEIRPLQRNRNASIESWL